MIYVLLSFMGHGCLNMEMSSIRHPFCAHVVHENPSKDLECLQDRAIEEYNLYNSLFVLLSLLEVKRDNQ